MTVKRFFHRTRRAADLQRELEAHLALEIDENRERGFPTAEAERLARVKLGSFRRVREDLWQQNTLTFIAGVWRDLGYAARTLRKTPGFTFTVVLILALGIGANTAIFTLMNALLLRSLPVKDPSTLVRLTMNVQMGSNTIGNVPVNDPIVDFLARKARSFDGIFGWARNDFVVNWNGAARSDHGALLSGNAFSVLGVRPALGRLLTPADDQPGGGPDGWAAVISHRMWMSAFHRDPNIVGKSIDLADHPVTIVGVAPAGFEGVIVADRPDFYLPLNFEPIARGPQSQLHSAASLWLTAFARLRPGVKPNQAAAEMTALRSGMFDAIVPAAARHAQFIENSRIAVEPGRTGWSYLPSEYKRTLLLLQCMIATALLVCCANVSGLCLARASARQKEFAIRGALGAAPARLLRQVLVESLLLAVAGALLGMIFAWPAARILVVNMGNSQVAQSLSARPDLAVLLATTVCAVACALFFGMAPAWQARKNGLEPILRQFNRQATRAGLRSVFIPLEVGLSLAFVVVAGLLGTTLMRLKTQDPGFRTENVLFAAANLERLPQKGTDLLPLYLRMIQAMQQMPGVQQASLAQITPLSGEIHSASFAGEHESAFMPSDTDEIGPNYFAALGASLIAGHDFSAQDMGSDSCILNQGAAARYFPGESALGQTLRQLNRDRKTGAATTHECVVVGVCANARYNSLRDTPPVVYLPVGPETNGLADLLFVLHGRDDASAAAAYRAVMHSMAPGAPEADPITFAAQFDESIARDRLLSLLSTFFAALALLLSGIGIYGLAAWSVAERTSEIGIRMALGATRARILSLVLGRMSILLAAGLTLGCAAAWFAAHAIRSFLFGIAPENPLWFALAATALVATAGIAALLPARRAASIDPAQALRSE